MRCWQQPALLWALCLHAVGALCELTHFVTVPERRRLFINARVIGRFQAQQVINDKPFLAGALPRACLSVKLTFVGCWLF